MKPHVTYTFHHFAIPVSDDQKLGRFSEKAGIYTEDHQGKFKVQWHRFLDDSPLHPLIKTVPHVAFKVNDLAEAIRDEEIILGPYEPIQDYFVAIINDAGVPIEFIQTELSDDELWERARLGQGQLYK